MLSQVRRGASNTKVAVFVFQTCITCSYKKKGAQNERVCVYVCVCRFGAGVFAQVFLRTIFNFLTHNVYIQAPHVQLLEFVFKETTGRKLQSTSFGKPFEATYKWAEQLMNAQARKLGHNGVSRIYAIGDNPKSDIAGASMAAWTSILVRTGIFCINY